MVFQALFAIVPFQNLDIKQMNVKTAFLHSILDWFLYMKI